MCGICGTIYFARPGSGAAPEHGEDGESIAHRGPDDEGYYISGSLGLGSGGSPIIDLEVVTSPVGRRGICMGRFNGEFTISGAQAELEGFGHVFRTSSNEVSSRV